MNSSGAPAGTRHPSALVDQEAALAPDVVVGPFAVVGRRVSVGPGSVIGPFAVLHPGVTLGRANHLGAGAVLGGEPQDVKYAGEPTTLLVGDGNRIGPYVTMSRGTPGGRTLTRIGSNNVLEAGSHIGHDCEVGNGLFLGAGAALAGHVVIEDGVEIGPLAGVHQFVRMGRLARAEGHSMVTRDVPPCVVVSGNPASPVGINRQGMERAGMEPETVAAMEAALDLLYHSGMRFEEAIERIAERFAEVAEVEHLVEFVRVRGRGVAR